ncbi:hypothetical protein [Afipia felis]|uniref:Uncharacterized protein n=2 Tax=Afipia felis TaxID=1035 RepID=A0A380W5K7_AFIFE|nr:hypothetical protein [Afipia felis]EKS26717.1 hypothetical protein HMPREF9697_04020 [Afipia felis ATCC 53690]SUU76133.1 Uncharacterised protein [Afipia felis]SUU84200.1 Uncharacterised protein [Afipia felis]SUW28249.1 Uncharacterised protein [Afipia felis]
MTPIEAAAVARLLDPPFTADPHRAYVAVYRNKCGANCEPYFSGRTFRSQREAWIKPEGPNVPDLEILDVLEVRYP